MLLQPHIKLEDKHKRNTTPTVSIIIPCRNEALHIERCLLSVLSQDYPARRLEILVVDGMSDDQTREIVQRLIRHEKSAIIPSTRDGSKLEDKLPSVRLLDNTKRIVPAALNIGLSCASGEVVFRLDGHSEMAPNYIRVCTQRLLQDSDVGCVGGPNVARGTGVIGNGYALALRTPFGVGGQTFRTLQTEKYVNTLAFGGYRREVFDKLGNFDLTLKRNQDIELNSRLRKAGLKLLLIPDTYTCYYGPRDIASVSRQNYSNGYWNTKLLDKMLGTLSWRHFVPGAFVVALILTFIAATFIPYANYLFFSIVLTYVLGCTAASLLALIKFKKTTALILPILFPVMHVSYGVGSICGLIEYCFSAFARKVRRK